MNTRAASLSHQELCARVTGKRGLICLLTDRIDEELLAAGRDLKVVANVAVGYDNINLAAARELPADIELVVRR